MATKSISQLDTAVSLANGDLFETAIPDAGSASGYASKKLTLAQIADYMANDVVYPDFETSAKSITGAVNQTLANFADEYSSSETYAEGDVVIYAGNQQRRMRETQTEAFINAYNHTARRVKDCVSVAGLELPAQLKDKGAFMETLAIKHAQYVYFTKAENPLSDDIVVY